jgi:hypothetical protein
MRCEVALMQFLFKKTKVPVPEIISFEAKLDSRIGAPYILMKRLPGKPAYVSWFEKCKDRNHLSENRVSHETEMMRCNILRSLLPWSNCRTSGLIKLGCQTSRRLSITVRSLSLPTHNSGPRILPKSRTSWSHTDILTQAKSS